MNEFNFENVKKLANMIMFDISYKEYKDIKQEFVTLLKQLELLDKVDTTNIKELIYPIETETTYLREDNNHSELSVSDVLKNVKDKENDYVYVPRVIK